MKKYIFFDLDGTLTDSAEGITNSVEYALNHYGISVQDKSSLNVFVGSALVDSFMKYYASIMKRPENPWAFTVSTLKLRGCLRMPFTRVYRSFSEAMKKEAISFMWQPQSRSSIL